VVSESAPEVPREATPECDPDSTREIASAAEPPGERASTSASAEHDEVLEPGGYNGRGVRIVSPPSAPELRVSGHDPAAAAPDPGEADAEEPSAPTAQDPAGDDAEPGPATVAPDADSDAATSADPGAVTTADPDPNAAAGDGPNDEGPDPLPPPGDPAPATSVGWQPAGPDVPTGEVPAEEAVERPMAEARPTDEDGTQPEAPPAAAVDVRDVDVLRDAGAARAAARIEAERDAPRDEDVPPEARREEGPAPLTPASPSYDRDVRDETVPSLGPREDDPTDEVLQIRQADRPRDPVTHASAEEGAPSDDAGGPSDDEAHGALASSATSQVPSAWDMEPVPVEEVAGEDDPLHTTAQLAILLDELHEREDDDAPGPRP
jgi:hypothetical protein